MTVRTGVVRWAALVLVVATCLAAVAVIAGCGSSDKWEGTWVQVDDTDTGLVIEKSGDTTYKISDPDGSNEFTATASDDGNTLSGTMDLSEDGQTSVRATATLTMTGDDRVTIDVAVNGQEISYELKKE